MIFDENEPQKQRDYTLGEKLEDFSVSELDELRARLVAEIERVEAETKSKQASKEAAASIFKN
ncbi:MAG: DUF1192 domain-containing protein [Pseudomonadota bacterium]